MPWSPRSNEAKKLTRLWRLKPSTKLCSDFYVLDVETAHRPGIPNREFKDSSTYEGVLKWQLKATPQSFVFGVIHGKNYTKVVHSVKEMKETLLEPRFKKKVVYAHNGGNFDYPCIYGNIYDTDSEAIFNGKFICFTNGNCTFADSVNIFVGMSIKEMGEMLGNKKLGMSNDYSQSIWPQDYSRDVNGCVKDCEILWDGLFQTFEFAGEIKITQASLSMAYYRRFHQPFHIDHNENTKFFWQSYFGGRTECFKIGRTHSSVIDVNSMYPYHLRNGIFPNPKTLKCESDFPLQKLPKYLEWYEGMLDCTLEHKKTSFGFLPVKKDNKLLFPVGTFRGSFNFPELRFALSKGVIKIKKIHTIVYGEKMLSPFASYVDTLHDMKVEAQQTKNKFAESMAKYFLNMLYGKFGQRIESEFIYIKDMESMFHIIQEYQQKRLFKKLVPFSGKRNDAMLEIKSAKSFNTPYAIPSFASYITSYGRVQLLEKMLSMESSKVVYCDTDSIFFEINNDVQSEKHLGGWKLENKVVTNIKGLKNYHYIDTKGKEVWRVKGVPVDKGREIKIFTDDGERTVRFVEQTSDNTFRYFNLMKSKEALRRGKEPGILTERLKEIKNTYDKRIVFADGETKPIIL